jgi:hypothetical protein
MVKRYLYVDDMVGNGMFTVDNGKYVLASDYAALEARCRAEEEAHAELQSRCFDYGGTFQNVFDDLKASKYRIAELEGALRKIRDSFPVGEFRTLAAEIEIWNIAKDALSMETFAEVCPACEGQPAYGNVPCAVCGATANRSAKP